MQYHSQQRHSFGTIASIAIGMCRAAAFAAFLTLASSSMGGDTDKAAPTQLSAMPAGVSSEKDSRAEPLNEPNDRPAGPTCANLDPTAVTAVPEGLGDSGDSVVCGVRGTLVAGNSASDRSEERTDLATLLAWHLRARNLTRLGQPAAAGSF
jgi:hypothetical protein